MARAPVREFAARHVRDFVAVHGDASRGGDVEAAEEIEQRGLTGAARAHEGHEIALVHVKIQALQDLDFLAAAAVSLIQTANFDETRGLTASIHSDHVPLPVRISTLSPSCKLSGPLTTSESPGNTPASTATSARRSTFPS